MKKAALIALFLGICALSRAQDYQFSQFYAVPLYYNPAFAGAHLNSRFTSSYRSQWTGMNGWRGWMSSFDWHLKKASSGLGLFFSQNTLREIGFQQSTGMLQYAYRGKLKRNLRVSAGLGLGFGQISWGFGGLTFGDQLIPDPTRAKSIDPVASGGLQGTYLDLQLGGLLYTQNWWASISALHPHSPSLRLVTENTIEPRINFSAGYRWELKKPVDYKGEISPNAITPALLLRNQGPNSQLDLGFYVHYVPLVFGVWYRGLPVPVKNGGGLNQDALTLLLGLKQNNLSIGYSYDLHLEGPVGPAGGSHEISVTYEFKTKYLSLKGLKQSKALPCPSF